ncbi:single-stranded DNA-binding protein [Yinghuangia sp. YIM S10712]|uniref:single-stranded DNA-binding protein n=1 Tax=Yinghuangia sp. YIM S10712 TaxID=3436930 RepID=UPI003F5395BF
MANNATYITVTGNLTRDPEGRFTASGVFVTRISIAVTPRRFDKQAGEWTDGETTYWDATAWRGLAEHAAESLRKGDRVIATGTVTTSRWEDAETGEPRSRVVLDLEDIGPSLAWATATVVKAGRSNGPNRATGAPQGDAWAGNGAAASGEPPF